MNNYKRLFEQISPRESDEALISKVRARKAEKMKNKSSKSIHFRKAAAISAAAVLAVGAVTVSVGAATNWDFTKLFEGFYSNVLNDYPCYENTVIEEQTITADLSQMGTNLDQTVDFGYGTVHFTGAIADSNVVMVMYELTVDDEVLTEYYSKHSNEGKKPWADLNYIMKPGCVYTEGYGSLLSMPVDTIGDNGVDCYRTDAYFYQTGYLSKDKVLELQFNTFNLYASDNSMWELELEEPVTLSLPLDFMNTDRIEVSPNVEITHDNYRYFLEDVVITPLNIQWYTQPGEKIERLPVQSDPLIYRFKDGTEVKNYSITETAEYQGDREVHSALLDNPIDINTLASVTIGDYTISFE